MHAWAAPEMFGASGHSGYSNLGGILGGWKPNTLKVLEDGNYQVEFVEGFAVPGPAPGGWAAAAIPYSNFELYLAGLISPEEVGHDIKQANGLSWIGKDNGIFSASSIETTFSYSGLQDMVISIVKIFDMKFTLYDGENLLFRLESLKELTP